MKVNTYVQYGGNEVLTAELEKRVKELWKAEGRIIKDIESLDMYLKAEENTCYYVINGTFSGKLPV